MRSCAELNMFINKSNLLWTDSWVYIEVCIWKFIDSAQISLQNHWWKTQRKDETKEKSNYCLWLMITHERIWMD